MSSEANKLTEQAKAEEQARRQVSLIAEEIAQLSEQDLQPAAYYNEFLQRVSHTTRAFAGAIWIRTPQGNLVLQCQINLRELGLDRTQVSRPMHDELLRQAVIQGKGGLIQPHVRHDFGTETEQVVAGNPTDFAILLVPIQVEKQAFGLVELWVNPDRKATVLEGFYQFLVRMAAFASQFQRNHQLRAMVGQQDLWVKLDAFSRQIHTSLNVNEVSYLIANEGRRLIEADRVSVAVRPAYRCKITAISGADVVEQRSNLVQIMTALADAVIAWGEKLIYTGTKDDVLPPKVLHALDAYLDESPVKIVIVMPLHDERDKESKKLARSALIMECFETRFHPDELVARLDVVGKHSVAALYNAIEYNTPGLFGASIRWFVNIPRRIAEAREATESNDGIGISMIDKLAAYVDRYQDFVPLSFAVGLLLAGICGVSSLMPAWLGFLIGLLSATVLSCVVCSQETEGHAR